MAAHSGTARIESAAPAPAFAESKSNVGYVLFLLTTVLTVAYVDRQIIAILIEPIRIELELADTEIGLLTGVAFSIFYATLGLPVALIADRTSRRGVIAGALTLWSLMTLACGFAQNFWHLAAARMGVGIGEAGCIPPAHSLIADYVPPERRSRAMGIYALGVPIGILIGMLIGGWLGQAIGWRAAFLAVGALGVFVALIVRLTLQEPLRGITERQLQNIPVVAVGIPEMLRHVFARRSLWRLYLGSGLQSMGMAALFLWTPSFLARSYGMSIGEIGTWLGLIIGIGGAIGSYTGGVIADRLGLRDPRWRLWAPAIALAAAGPMCLLALFQSTSAGTLVLLAPPVMLGLMPTGPTFANVQTLLPRSMRTMGSALLVFVNNALGVGLAPVLIGFTSDATQSMFGANSLRAALVLVPVMFLGASLAFFASSRSLDRGRGIVPSDV